jgi:hypothetical protein
MQVARCNSSIDPRHVAAAAQAAFAFVDEHHPVDESVAIEVVAAHVETRPHAVAERVEEDVVGAALPRRVRICGVEVVQVVQILRARLEVSAGRSRVEPTNDVEGHRRTAARHVAVVRPHFRLQVRLELRGRRRHVLRKRAAGVVLVARIDSRIEVVPRHHEDRHAQRSANDGASRPDEGAVAPIYAVDGRDRRLPQAQPRWRGAARIHVSPAVSNARRDAHFVRVRPELRSAIGAHAIPGRCGGCEPCIGKGSGVGRHAADFHVCPGDATEIRRSLDLEAIFAAGGVLPREIHAVCRQRGGRQIRRRTKCLGKCHRTGEHVKCWKPKTDLELLRPQHARLLGDAARSHA